MRALIIGGTRFIGAHIARMLFDAGNEVTVFHRGRSENPLLPAVHHVRDPSAEYPITRFPHAIAAQHWDVVVHMVMMGEADGRAAVETFAGRAGRLVMISSGDVYRAYGRLTRLEPGEPVAMPLTEEAALRNTLYPYRAHAKRLGSYAHDYEKILAEAAVRNADALPWTILRLPKVYGQEDNADLATVYGFASQPDWRWTHGHVDNVASAIVLAATHELAAGHIFNVGEEHTPTMRERLERLPPATERAKPPPFDFRQGMVCDTAKIRKRLGYVDAIDEADAMLRCVEGARRAVA